MNTFEMSGKMIIYGLKIAQNSFSNLLFISYHYFQ